MNQLSYIREICLNETFNTKEEVFEKIAEIAEAHLLTSSKQSIIDGLKNREKVATTGFLDGFAIPHTKAEGITEASAIILTLTEGIEWDSMDGKPTRFIISLLTPESEASTTHLALLSSISRILIHQDVRDNLLHAKAEDEIVNELNRAHVNL
jgi:PTS system fructose-specific IIA component